MPLQDYDRKKIQYFALDCKCILLKNFATTLFLLRIPNHICRYFFKHVLTTTFFFFKSTYFASISQAKVISHACLIIRITALL